MNMKRIVSFGLCILIILSLLIPVGAFADDELIFDDYWAEEEIFDDYWTEEEEYNEDAYLEDLPEEYMDLYFENSEEEYTGETIEELIEADSKSPEEEYVDDSSEYATEEEAEAVPNVFALEDAEVFFNSDLEITEQPKDITAPDGTEVTWTVTASTEDVTYKWQYKNGSSWNDWANGSGASLTKTVSKYWNGWKIRVIVTDKSNPNNSVISDEVTLTVNSDIVINDVTYRKLMDGTYEVASYSGSASSLTIPAKVENADVTKIGDEAFLNKTSLTSISLPNSITVIGARAFKGCTNLSQMTTHD